MSYNLLGFLLLAFLTLTLGTVAATRWQRHFPVQLLMLALALRIFGSLVRYQVLEQFYRGAGDAKRYFGAGLAFAQSIWNLDFSVLTYFWWFGGYTRWWGTRFVENISGLVVTVIGPTIRGEFLFFALWGFAGIYLITVAFARYFPGFKAVSYARWVWLWPSLWFWPSSVGKEAVVIFCVGLAFYGFAGRGGRVSWIPLVTGLLLSFAIRPHVTAVLALSMFAGQWLQSRARLGVRTIFEALLLLVVAMLALSGMAAQLGIDQADLEGVQEYVEYQAQQTMAGGSSIEAAPIGLIGIPGSIVNIWMRPFPWEAHNAMALFSAIEVLVLWGLIWKRRRALRLAMRHFRRSRLLCFAVVMVFLYTIMIGLAFANLGIIARQRTPLFPFIFMLLTAARAQRPQRAARPIHPVAAPVRHRARAARGALGATGTGPS